MARRRQHPTVRHLDERLRRLQPAPPLRMERVERPAGVDQVRLESQLELEQRDRRVELVDAPFPRRRRYGDPQRRQPLDRQALRLTHKYPGVYGISHSWSRRSETGTALPDCAVVYVRFPAAGDPR